MLEVGIVGLGTIGKVVAKALDEGMMGLRLQAVASGQGPFLPVGPEAPGRSDVD